MSKISRITWSFLIYNIFVVLWGALVRATGSGAGCGAHWPLCNGVVLPRSPQIETLIELTHRVTSGFVLIGAIIFFILIWRQFPRKNVLRLTSSLVLFFTLSEAIIGAGLVLFELVAHNASYTRIFSIVAHLINTFFLLAAIVVSAWWLTNGTPKKICFKFRSNWQIIFILIGVLIVGASGAITALGDTLFPASSFYSGFLQDFELGAHLLIRLRIFHPIIAVVTGGGILLFAAFYRGNSKTMVMMNILRYTVITQLLLGAVNVVLLAPVWMQIIHLFVSIVVWLLVVLIFIESIWVE